MSTEGPTEDVDDDDPGDNQGRADALQEPSPAGKRIRRKLDRLLNEDDHLSGSVELMVAPADDSHRVVLRGARLTSRGGPAGQILELAERLKDVITAVMPTADPYIGSLQGSNSVEIVFYAPEPEVLQARLRRTEFDDEDKPEATGPEEEPARTEISTESLGPDDASFYEYQALPDTTIALTVLARLVDIEEPVEAARAARRINTSTARELRRLSLALADKEVELDLGEVERGAVATPEWSLRVVEQLDAREEERPTTVSVIGVLQGANSAGEGEFEIKTDSDQPLDPAFGPRRSPGDTIRGQLTPKARAAIRRDNLWDTHVEARVQLIRRRQGRSVRIESMRLVSVKARFRGNN